MNAMNCHKWIRQLPLFLGLSLLSACQEKDAGPFSDNNPPTVITQSLSLSEGYQRPLEFSGTIRAANTTGVGFELAGKLSGLFADSGNRVQKGQLLAALDTSLLEAEQQELKAALSQNSADLSLAQSTLKRSQELKKQGYVSSQQLDELEGRLGSLEGARERLKASLYANTLKLEKSRLLAPFDGSIGSRSFNLGEVVPLGQPVFVLVEDKAAQAHVGVPADIAKTLTQGQLMDLRVGREHYRAVLAGINPAIDPVTRTVGLRLSLPPDAHVLNGEIAYLNYQQQVNTPGFWVPVSALTDGLRGLWNLYVVEPHGENEFVVERRDVEILFTDKDRAYLVGALKAGDEIVTQGLHKLVVGEHVQPMTALATR
ncbi:efflux RND transporter periplasmic adaptor subunit [Shewanella litorisediminis]|uniref:Efflux RND transporter periplasmic adaptor subunit n=1 Tax=Shewanella litorisediminis TaxID=1173586 RepID=A0ABX7G015_9GAMM|nr:efflux RND transporter periplasmic adaptor subunit [Shewanella litorisediminis]MCL2918334.1 efflux RND transporter periplasmic adaptor subunit [Shewanella litorisediminis]QRH00619.1 efflux RND transporter periplasmic adaptor subunit [Shewanella litorisediminis]